VRATLSSLNTGWTLAALGLTWGCTTWTSVHGGYGYTPEANRSVAGLEVRRAVGGAIDSAYGLAGARLDGSEDQFDADLHLGIMRPLRLSEEFMFVPSATFEALRLSRVDARWYGGAFGPGLGSELLWWLSTTRREYDADTLFGCMGGVEGHDCPRACRVEDVTRHGIGLRVAAEYDMRLGENFPDLNDWIVWLTVGVTRARSPRENECCYYDRHAPLRSDCPSPGAGGRWP
jgi:hypothetical protein